MHKFTVTTLAIPIVCDCLKCDRTHENVVRLRILRVVASLCADYCLRHNLEIETTSVHDELVKIKNAVSLLPLEKHATDPELYECSEFYINSVEGCDMRQYTFWVPLNIDKPVSVLYESLILDEAQSKIIRAVVDDLNNSATTP